MGRRAKLSLVDQDDGYDTEIQCSKRTEAE